MSLASRTQSTFAAAMLLAAPPAQGRVSSMTQGVPSGAAAARAEAWRMWTYHGSCATPEHGGFLVCAGDVNRDGLLDLIAGNPNVTRPPAFESLSVFSGADGSVLHTFRGRKKNAGFGFSVSGAGDTNADGFDDVIVGTYGRGEQPGAATVFSGRDGSILHELSSSPGYAFGFSVSGAGDVNHDGFADVSVGDHAADQQTELWESRGSASVFSGRDGAILYSLRGASPGAMFGFSVSGAGDVNLDGHADLIVGARYDDSASSRSGSATVFSGVDRSVLYVFRGSDSPDEILDSFHGDLQGMAFGLSVGAAGDVDADGIADLIVGAPSEQHAGMGSVHVFSGLDGCRLFAFRGDQQDDFFGSAVAGAGDANGDGYDDLLVGAPGSDDGFEDCGTVRILSGADGSLLWIRTGSPGSRLGVSVSGMVGPRGPVGVAARDFSRGAETSLAVASLIPREDPK